MVNWQTDLSEVEIKVLKAAYRPLIEEVARKEGLSFEEAFASTMDLQAKGLVNLLCNEEGDSLKFSIEINMPGMPHYQQDRDPMRGFGRNNRRKK